MSQVALPERLTHEKILYPSRKGMTKEMVNKVIGIEVTTFERDHPEYVFVDLDSSRKDDRTTVLKLKFILKEKLKESASIK